MKEGVVSQIQATFEEKTKAQTKWVATAGHGGKGIDGTLIIHIDDWKITLPVQVKQNVNLHHVVDLARLGKYFCNLTIMANIIQPRVKEELKTMGINYLDTAGNVFIKREGVLIILEGHKKIQPLTDLRDRAFSKAGLKILYQLFLDKSLVNQTIREIAQRADVSLDSVHKTLNGLKELNYLVPLDKKRLKWNNRKELLGTWITAYEQRLKPSLLIDTFRFADKENFFNWKHLPLSTDTQWGGEPAGDIYTNYLKPEMLTIYTRQNRTALIKDLRIVPDMEGDIKVYKTFWNFPTHQENVVTPLLTYTDLVNTGNKRNIETANRIYEQHLQDQF